MAQFKQVNFHVERSTYATGSICSIHYEYFLTFKAEEIKQAQEFIVYCELWGINKIRTKVLTDEKFDAHKFNAKHSLDLARSFAVPCELLNETVGEDHLFIKLKLVMNENVIHEIESDVVHDNF